MRLLQRSVDRVIVQEVKATYADIPIQPSDVVLDLGANIGASARLFLDKGAAKVIAIEPDPRNVLLAQRNLAGQPALVIWAAVASTIGRTTVHVRKDKPYLTSTISDTDRKAVPGVPTLTLSGLLAKFHPTVVKCDIEFGEYDLPELRALPAFVRVLALEVHIRYDLVFANLRQTDEELRAKRSDAAELIAAIEGQGFGRVAWKEKQAKAGPIEDDTGLKPLTKSVDAIWER